MCFPENSQKPLVWLVSLSQNCAKIRNSTHLAPNPISYAVRTSKPNFIFFPFHLKKMSGTPKLDPFHEVKIAPKSGKSTDRDQNSTDFKSQQDLSVFQISDQLLHLLYCKCRGTPNFTCFTNSKFRQKSTDCSQNLISSEDGQETLVYQIKFVLQKMHETPISDLFLQNKIVPKWENQQKMAKIWYDTSACLISYSFFYRLYPENVEKSQIWSLSLSKNCTQIRKNQQTMIRI